ncbi:MAG: EAL domain-containing protein [Lachnospiraceae bacterium]|nr:EAL domain-containing protein [Lachnospiraceae bacterium]
MADKNKREKTYKKIKKKNIWSSIVAVVLFSILSVLVLAAIIQTLTLYVIDEKLSAEYESIKDMGKLYEGKVISDLSGLYSLLDSQDRDYVIVNEAGNVLHQKGEATYSAEKKEMSLSDHSESIFVYTDTTERGVLFIDQRGLVSVDVRKLHAWLRSTNEEDFVNKNKIEEYEARYENTGFSMFGGWTPDLFGLVRDSLKVDKLEFPIWISLDVNKGMEELIVRAMVQINTRDFLLILELVVVVMALIGLILVAMLISTLSTAVKQRRITTLFFNDGETGAHNWMWFLIKGQHRLRRSNSPRNRFAVVNLEFVKYRNYCVCHSLPEGQKMLKKVHGIINGLIGRKEMCAHCSSSNFALLLRYHDVEELKNRVYGIIEHLELIGEDKKFSFQAGIYLIDPFDDIDLERDYNNACTARASMADSDDSGIVLFDDRFADDQKWLSAVEERQSAALANEEFIVYYQPKYDPSTQKLKGAEALIRWESPDLGFVSPGKFIPIFEKNGFITSIDHYMLEHVAKDQKRWLDAGYKCVPVSVNVSRAHFVEDDLAGQITSIVDNAGTPHEYIEIELTESAFFDDKKAMISTISKLQQNGFAVSMDDFGSGYSSLNSLKDMPLDVLKLDAEFFRGDNTGDRGRVVVSEAINIAKKLNMRTVAEGVEEKEQVDFLASQGCDMIQGYYFAKPMPGSDYEKRMSAEVAPQG